MKQRTVTPPDRFDESGDRSSSEPFVRQVVDHSLPAEQVLTEQAYDHQPDDPARVFVP